MCLPTRRRRTRQNLSCARAVLAFALLGAVMYDVSTSSSVPVAKAFTHSRVVITGVSSRRRLPAAAASAANQIILLDEKRSPVSTKPSSSSSVVLRMATLDGNDGSNNNDEVDSIKTEIEQMRMEALRRIEALSSKISSSSPESTREDLDEEAVSSSSSPSPTSDDSRIPRMSFSATSSNIRTIASSSQQDAYNTGVVDDDEKTITKTTTVTMDPPEDPPKSAGDVASKSVSAVAASSSNTNTKRGVQQRGKSQQTGGKFVERIAINNDPSLSAATTTTTTPSAPPTTTTTSSTSSSSTLWTENNMAQIEKEELNLLDGTCWKVMLNVGREPGTWMPKTWGISGERLLLSLELQFTPQQLYESEEFLNGIGDAKVLHVVNNILTLGPSMTEGSRIITVHDGGWRIGRGEGPLGTDILRFYVQVQDEVRHQGGDVYCPAGRVYCTCGYFPMTRPKMTDLKEHLRKRQEELGRKYDRLTRELDDDGSLISFHKLALYKELIQTRLDAGKVTAKLNEARIREPDKSLLRLSKKRDVGLTREGGVCCKVEKGMATEYHILGKFGVAATDPRKEEDAVKP